MSQGKGAPQDRATIARTLHWFWWVTKKKPFATFMAVFTSVTYTALLTYANTWVMGLIIDRIQAEPVTADKVAVFRDRPKVRNRMHHGSAAASGVERE